MVDIIQTIVSGVILGSLFAIMAMGLSMIFGTMRILNFSHGSFLMSAAYFLWFLATSDVDPQSKVRNVGASGLSLNFFASLIVGIGLVFLIGMATERSIVRPLKRKPNWEITTLIATLALGLILPSLALANFGGRTKTITSPFVGSFTFPSFTGQIFVTTTQIVIIAVSIGVLVALSIFLKKSKIGMAIRAIPQDPEAAALMGIWVDRVNLWTFSLGAALAALSGVLLANVLFISPDMGTEPMLTAFIVIIFGGIGSVPGTIFAAYILGMIRSFAEAYIALSYGLPVMFAFMLIVMILRPRGLFGLRE